MRVAIRQIFVCLVFAVLASHAAADETQFFGPKKFANAAGKPQTFSESIPVDSNASCQGKATFTLVVENSGVSSAEIRLNGNAVLSERDFSQNRPPIQKPVTLAAENILSILLKGGKKAVSST